MSVGRIEAPSGSRGAKPYVRSATLPLNDRAELELALEGILDRLFGDGPTM